MRHLGRAIISGSMQTYKRLLAIACLVLIASIAQPQNKAPKTRPKQATTETASDIHEMLLTQEGLLAFDTPKGWVRSKGPGLASFVPKASGAKAPVVVIYISEAPVGADQTDKTLSDYVQSDIAAFKARFEKAIVHQEQPILLLTSQVSVPLYTFKSGEKHNTVEQVAYIQDTAQRVLTVVLSAKTEEAFSKSLSAFQGFVKSFRGSVTADHASK